MNAKERSTAWAVDQLDPDNWLRIPDFGINPKDVVFEGFSFPIVTPMLKGYGLRCIVREHVKTARALMRKEERSLSDVRTDFIEVLDMTKAKPESEKIDASPSQAMATFYTFAMQSAELADRLSMDRNSRSLERCYEAIAHCAEEVRNLMVFSLSGKKESHNTAIDEAMRRYVDSQRRALSEAGRRGASAKHETTRALKKWALEQANGMRGSDRDIARRLSAMLPAHLADASNDPMRLIYDTLRTRQNRIDT